MDRRLPNSVQAGILLPVDANREREGRSSRDQHQTTRDGLGIALYVGGHEPNEASDWLLVRLATEDGTFDWGETQPYPSKRTAVDVIENETGPWVVGSSTSSRPAA